jgi:hypothetical protein
MSKENSDNVCMKLIEVQKMNHSLQVKLNPELARNNKANELV